MPCQRRNTSRPTPTGQVVLRQAASPCPVSPAAPPRRAATNPPRQSTRTRPRKGTPPLTRAGQSTPPTARSFQCRLGPCHWRVESLRPAASTCAAAVSAQRLRRIGCGVSLEEEWERCVAEGGPLSSYSRLSRDNRQPVNPCARDTNPAARRRAQLSAVRTVLGWGLYRRYGAVACEQIRVE